RRDPARHRAPRRDLGEELLFYGGGKRLEILHLQQESAVAADHLVIVIGVEPGLAGEDGEAVDGDSLGVEGIADIVGAGPDIRHAVARYINDSPRRLVRRVLEGRARGE